MLWIEFKTVEMVLPKTHTPSVHKIKSEKCIKNLRISENVATTTTKKAVRIDVVLLKIVNCNRTKSFFMRFKRFVWCLFMAMTFCDFVML